MRLNHAAFESMIMVGFCDLMVTTSMGDSGSPSILDHHRDGTIMVWFCDLMVTTSMGDSGSPSILDHHRDGTIMELDDPIALIYEKKISNINSVIKVLELALKKQRPPLSVAEDVKSEPLATLILNKLCAGIKVCAIICLTHGPGGHNPCQGIKGNDYIHLSSARFFDEWHMIEKVSDSVIKDLQIFTLDKAKEQHKISKDFKGETIEAYFSNHDGCDKRANNCTLYKLIIRETSKGKKSDIYIAIDLVTYKPVMVIKALRCFSGPKSIHKCG
ncbi:chaperonin CPN60-2 [Artemisia annua]|uniref:Chaperonin CPN60-2 n=1 Tax=Artemisia annua TaxID=35608 RepID=A0A2U1KI46_ARTAN|nr:chaperonin CPN60-2 [Artemisia annua]